MRIDALIVGGGITGLWLRALLKESGRSVVLVESAALGSGQTIASQGILHAGAKYAAHWDTQAELISVLPVMSCAWGMHLRGENLPCLTGTRIVADESWYWNPDGTLPACLQRWRRQFSLATAALGTPPTFLNGPPRAGLRCRETSISPQSLLVDLAGTDRRDLLLVPPGHLQWTTHGPGEVVSIAISDPDRKRQLELCPSTVYFTAGAANAALRAAVGLPGECLMQRRPLQMGLVRGRLPTFCGHWFDAEGPRLTISTQFDSAGRTIWQLGGRLGEHPEAESPEMFIRRARGEICAGLPGVDLSRTEWSSYSAVRAEPVAAAGTSNVSPDDGLRLDGNVVTIWPIKMSLLPYVMIDIRRALERGSPRTAEQPDLPDWPHPEVAQPPWETEREWSPDSQVARLD